VKSAVSFDVRIGAGERCCGDHVSPFFVLSMQIVFTMSSSSDNSNRSLAELIRGHIFSGCFVVAAT
jgi:hypothetical protein